MGKAILSLSTNAFPVDQLIPCLEFAAARALPGVEVGPHHARRLEESPRELADARAAFERLGVKSLSMHSFKQLGVRELDQTCAFAAELGAELVVVHCRHEEIEEDFDAQVAMLREWDEWCRARAMVLTVENSSIQPLEAFVRLFDAIPDLHLTLDVKHAYKPEKLGLTHADYMRALGNRAANFHISGIDRSRDALGDGCPPGRDHVDWPALAEDLAQRDYSGLITMELNLPTYMSVSEQEEAYFDLPAASPDLPTVSHRLAWHAIRFFREALVPCLSAARGA